MMRPDDKRTPSRTPGRVEAESTHESYSLSASTHLDGSENSDAFHIKCVPQNGYSSKVLYYSSLPP